MKRSIFSLFTLSDEQAMWRVQSQEDPQAFAQLVARWEEPIQRLCTRMLGDSHRGEDLTQEIFTRLFVHRDQYQPQARFSTYLWRVALNRCYDELRRRQRREEASLDDTTGESAPLLDVLAASEPAPDAMLEAQERAALVRQALAQLPELYRAVVILRHYENLKFREIAEVLEIPEGTVKSRMAEALNLLNQHLSQLMEKGVNSCPINTPKNPRSQILAL